MMEAIPSPESPAAESNPRPYPTVAESWGALGWFLLLALLTGLLSIPFFQHTTYDRSIIVTAVASDTAKVLIVVFLLWKVPAVRRSPLRLFAPHEVPLVYLLLPLLVLAQMALRTLVMFLHLPNWMRDTMQKLEQLPVLAFFVLCVSAPILEELLFRGLLLPGLLKNYGPRKAIVQSSLVFGVFHLNPVQIVSACLLGLFLGWLYYRTQSLVACIVAHFLNNAVAWGAMQNPKWQNTEDLTTLLPDPAQLVLPMLVGAVVFAVGVWLIQRATRFSKAPESA